MGLIWFEEIIKKGSTKNKIKTRISNDSYVMCGVEWGTGLRDMNGVLMMVIIDREREKERKDETYSHL